MNLERVEQIAKAVLYEGYLLYPYRPSSIKNRQRFNFGVLYPKAYSDASDGAEPCSLRTECLIRGSGDACFEAVIRFLHLQTRSASSSESLPHSWQEAVEREIRLPQRTLEELCSVMLTHSFALPGKIETVSNKEEVCQEAVAGTVEVSASRIASNLFKVSLQVDNVSALQPSPNNRDAALMRSMVSTHAILGVANGEFISLLDPPEDLRELAGTCQNAGVWPVLVGDPGQKDTMLASPIILYDYPQIAPESAGDLFDGTEIDEILSLRIMTLTDEEKREIRVSDQKARRILERTESMPAEQFMKLHGTIRHPHPHREDIA